MALTEQEEQEARSLLTAFQQAKCINELAWAEGEPINMVVAVQEEDNGTLAMNLREAVKVATNPMAGRYWDETNAGPKAAMYYGNLAALRDLPQRLGLGRYLVTDDRVRRKLDPLDSTRFEDGSPARLDGSMGQCMWCWNPHYYTTWQEGNRTVEVITFSPVEGKKSVYVPAGGISWLNAGVLDRADYKLCSLISTEERYRGGNGNALVNYTHLADDAPQKTMLGMPATAINFDQAGLYARKRGEGWEACWYVARAVVEYTLRIILGTRHIQDRCNSALNYDGLYQTGLGAGVTEMTGWDSYNGQYPLIPTNIGLEIGDGIGIVEYNLTQADGTLVYTASVPVFLGLVNPFGHLWTGVRGILIDQRPEQTRAYAALSMKDAFPGNTTEGLEFLMNLPATEGYIKKYSTHLLCCLPTEVGATYATYFCDYFGKKADLAEGMHYRAAGGAASRGREAGAFGTEIYFMPPNNIANMTFPLCYFERDPQMTR